MILRFSISTTSCRSFSIQNLRKKNYIDFGRQHLIDTMDFHHSLEYPKLEELYYQLTKTFNISFVGYLFVVNQAQLERENNTLHNMEFQFTYIIILF